MSPLRRVCEVEWVDNAVGKISMVPLDLPQPSRKVVVSSVKFASTILGPKPFGVETTSWRVHRGCEEQAGDGEGSR